MLWVRVALLHFPEVLFPGVEGRTLCDVCTLSAVLTFFTPLSFLLSVPSLGVLVCYNSHMLLQMNSRVAAGVPDPSRGY